MNSICSEKEMKGICNEYAVEFFKHFLLPKQLFHLYAYTDPLQNCSLFMCYWSVLFYHVILIFWTRISCILHVCILKHFLFFMLCCKCMVQNLDDGRLLINFLTLSLVGLVVSVRVYHASDPLFRCAEM